LSRQQRSLAQKAFTEKSIDCLVNDDPESECPMCGIHAMFSKGRLLVVQYAVSEKFMISWARAER
jgi:hypothetical protein